MKKRSSVIPHNTMRGLGLPFLALIGSFLFAAPLLATTYTYDFSQVPGHVPTTNFDPGTSETFSSNGITITATGYSSPGNLTDLYVKSGGTGENGLGLNSDPDHEISGRGFVQLDLAPLIAVGGTVELVVVESVQSGESYQFYKSSSAGALGTAIGSTSCGAVTCTETLTLDSTNHYLDLKAVSYNVLLSSLTSTTPVPEPTSLLLLGAGLVGLAAWRKWIAPRGSTTR